MSASKASPRTLVKKKKEKTFKSLQNFANFFSTNRLMHRKVPDIFINSAHFVTCRKLHW